ncbi:hypothetical protein ISF_04926 [Cordyceps fumosorosea ARSEF 2679]|uniref:Uncharacterized protein n=1 Tax=Cordyceps fumosorosea (strain ARSEF 2679) TaxID=1081104 RepID=A0A167VWB8_CORFA|nr:hypothetical protein ISF_04926 [Cordyceps fumosorosea ARSEF 2679]OAA63050.1 hypothetical protein ISF_04926 [Cordyceps fumosorosea ARSEF 2679]
MIPTLVRRLAQPVKEAAIKSAQASNFHQTKKVWPPNFKELSHQQQLRFEKKYKRRVSLANRAPRWEKGVKYAQLATITAALIWLLFYSEFEWWGKKYKPSEEIRRRAQYLFGVMDPDKRYERRKDMVEPASVSSDNKESPSK